MSEISRITVSEEIELRTTGRELVEAIYVKTGRRICYANPFYENAEAEKQGKLSWIIFGGGGEYSLNPRNIEHVEAWTLAVAEKILAMGGLHIDVVRNVPACCPSCRTDMVYDMHKKKWLCGSYCDERERE